MSDIRTDFPVSCSFCNKPVRINLCRIRMRDGSIVLHFCEECFEKAKARRRLAVTIHMPVLKKLEDFRDNEMIIGPPLSDDPVDHEDDPVDHEDDPVDHEDDPVDRE